MLYAGISFHVLSWNTYTNSSLVLPIWRRHTHHKRGDCWWWGS